MIDIEKLKTIRKAIQDLLEAYNTAYTPAQIEARNSCSDCLIMINEMIYDQL